MSDEEKSGFGSSWLGRILRGLIKLGLSGFIVASVNAVSIPDLNLSGSVISGALFKAILQFAIPLALIISALKDFGVNL
jgi:hypothetical protein